MPRLSLGSKVFTNTQLINSLTLMSLAFCKTQKPLRVPEEIKRVFNPRVEQISAICFKELNLRKSSTVWMCLVTRRTKQGPLTMRHVHLLSQSLLSAFTTWRPYVLTFLFHSALNRGEQTIWARGSISGELLNQ